MCSREKHWIVPHNFIPENMRKVSRITATATFIILHSLRDGLHFALVAIRSTELQASNLQHQEPITLNIISCNSLLELMEGGWINIQNEVNRNIYGDMIYFDKRNITVFVGIMFLWTIFSMCLSCIITGFMNMILEFKFLNITSN